MTHKVILDVDTGNDDAVSIMLAWLHPEIDLLAVCTVNGHVPVDQATENTLKVLHHIGADQVPVYEGMASPFVRPDFPDPERRTSRRIGDRMALPAPDRTAEAMHAADYYVETLMASEGDISIAMSGTHSNLAMALRQEPRIVGKIKEIVIMGGGYELCNVTPAAENNIWSDPEGARVVLRSGAPIRLVTLDQTIHLILSPEQIRALERLGTPAGSLTANLVNGMIAKYGVNPDWGLALHDPITIAAIIDPGILTTEHVYVDVETFGELTVGRTVVDFHRRSGQAPNAHVAVGVDPARFTGMLLETFG